MSKIQKQADLWKQIHDLIDQRDIAGAKKHIDRFERLEKLNPKRRALLSVIYERLNCFNDAIRVLGGEMGSSELESATQDEIFVQMRLAYLLNQLGAKYVGERIYKNIDQLLKIKKLDPLKINPFYFVQKFYAYRLNYLYIKILNEIDQYIEMCPTDDLRSTIHLKLYKSFALHGVDRTEDGLKLNQSYIDDPQTVPYLKALGLRAQSAMYFALKKYDLALEKIEECQKQFKNDAQSREKMLYLYSHAEINLAQKNYDQAKKNIHEIMQIIDNNLKLPNDSLSLLHLLNCLPDFELLLPYQISLRSLKIAFYYFAYGLGKEFKGSEDSMMKMPSYITSNTQGAGFDCWLVVNNRIYAANYQTLNYQYLQSLKQSIVDTYSGILIDTNSNLAVLSELQCNLLATLIGSGAVGINQWSLYDNTYRYVQMSEVGLERIKDLVKGMRKINVEISRESNFYFYKFKRDEIIILPMHDLKGQGTYHYLKHFKSEFDRHELQTFFNIKKTAGINWLNEWLELNIIKSSGKGKNLKYHFNDQ